MVQSMLQTTRNTTSTAELSMRVGNSGKWTSTTTTKNHFCDLKKKRTFANLGADKYIFLVLGTKYILRIR